MGGLLYLVQQGGASARPGPVQNVTAHNGYLLVSE